MIKKILVATDGSDHAKKAIDHARVDEIFNLALLLNTRWNRYYLPVLCPIDYRLKY